MNKPHNDKPAAPGRKQLSSVAIRLHEEACKLKKDGYVDPDSGAFVFSEYYLKSRGYCCGNGCRHCPYN
ncbi:MAG: hypothetical protein HUU54_13090 [Ignavibacteriaceae bacterium]|nr:hypothetical protein [Ignavibacteriaceae bacterium]